MKLNKASVASELLGFGPGSGGLEKLRITVDQSADPGDGSIEALFNPREITRSRSIEWRPMETAGQGGGLTGSDTRQQFHSVGAETLDINLFFDTYESRAQASGWKQAASFVQPINPFQASGATSVTVLTDQIAELAAVDRELHHPPICHLSWGTNARFFTGVLTRLNQHFTLFLPDGTPVRATLSCSFLEFETQANSRARETHSADVVKTRVVRRHDTLHSIAAEEYRDPGRWRHIAIANGIINPREVRPGTILTIPKLSR